MASYLAATVPCVPLLVQAHHKFKGAPSVPEDFRIYIGEVGGRYGASSRWWDHCRPPSPSPSRTHLFPLGPHPRPHCR
jgi:hypothetical protein